MIPLTELNALAEKASRGPWTPGNGFVLMGGANTGSGVICSVINCDGLTINNRDFIAACDPETVKAMIARINKAEAQHSACLAELARIARAIGTRDGHSSVDHICRLMEVYHAAEAYQSTTWGTLMEGEAIQARLDRALAVFAGKGVGA